jgi:glycopeptide antibiotics resistance protein
MVKIMKDKKAFNLLMNISLVLFVLVLIFAIVLKAIMPQDLIANYQFLSSMSVNERLMRGLKIIEFYQIEAQIGELTKAIILDVLNVIVFIPFGILIAHLFKTKRILKSLIITFIFVFIVEIFQLYTIIGAFMLNDILINLLGGLIGCIIYILVIKKEKYKVYNVLLLIFISLCMVALIYLLVNFINNIEVYINIFTDNL